MKNLVDIEEKNFNKFLIVGNKYSNYKFVERLLIKNGIEKASKLKREKISPKSISKIVLELNDIKKSKKFSINPIWNGLAMDLLLSNRKKDYWLWSDGKAIDILDFWKGVDSNIAFILIYSTPENFIKKLLEKSDRLLTKEKIDLEVKKWLDYNRKLLNFFYRNNDSSILVNSEQVSQNSMEYLTRLKEQKLLKNINIKEEVCENQEVQQDDIILKYLISETARENEELNNIYQEMQSCANFPLIESEQKIATNYELLNIHFKNIKLNDSLKDKNEFLESKLFLVEEELKKSYLEKKEDEQKFKNVKKKLEQEKAQKQNIQKELDDLKKELDKQKAKKIETLKENELILVQLFSVQEELEKIYLENIEDKKSFESVKKELEQEKTQKQNIQKKLEIQKSEKQNIQKKIDTLNNEVDKQKANRIESSKEKELKKEENELLLTQLFLVQEELEKYYLENQNLKDKNKKPATKRQYGAADRIRKQLSYRLGAKMISESKSFGGVVTLPFLLRAEVKKFRTEQKNKKKLPPIHTYTDAYEAEKMKKHLSYKLGYELIECFKSPFVIFTWPWAIKKAKKEYKESK